MKFIIISTILLIAAIVAAFIFIDTTSGAVTASIIAGIFYFAAFSTWQHFDHEKKSLENPYTLSENDWGKIFKVVEIRGDRIALVPWGYIYDGIGALQEVKDYYYIDPIPQALREVNSFFKVEAGFVFKKVKKNGYSDRSLPPLEILEKAYA